MEFSQAWDNYMSDYEATAYLSLEKLKVSEFHSISSASNKSSGFELSSRLEWHEDSRQAVSSATTALHRLFLKLLDAISDSIILLVHSRE